MKKENRFFILSSKQYTDYYPLQVVYEWEQVIADTLNIPLDFESFPMVAAKFDNKINQQVQKGIRNSFLKKHIDSSFNYFKRHKKHQYLVSFLLNPIPISNHYIYQQNAVVILLDVFANTIDQIPVLFKNKLIFVTNIEVMQYFENHPVKKQLRYIPLSISDEYYSVNVPKKKIDVIQVGRQNVVLHDWMLKVVVKHPEIEYVYAKMEDGVNVYFSTKRGILKEDTRTRAAFMSFLGSAKISLLSAPGIDGGENIRTGGYNPVTPRFYESAVNYCYMIGRFPDSADFVENQVSSVCERPADYEEFESTVLHMIDTPFDRQKAYGPFIKEHLTSTIAQKMKIELDKLEAI